jgi:hypothetical protein
MRILMKNSPQVKKSVLKCSEVVSKAQIRFKGPAWQRDFASISKN